MLIKTFAAAVQGIEAELVTIEVNVTRGCMFYLVGLPDSAVKESQQRVISAIQVNGYNAPAGKIVVNMAPADLRKEGSAYDLPLAIGLMSGCGMISPALLPTHLLMGEMSLDGTLRPIKGALPIALMARQKGFKGIILPKENAREAAVVNGIEVFGAENLKQVIEHMQGNASIPLTPPETFADAPEVVSPLLQDFAEVKGQEQVKRALEVAAAGGHNLIMIGPPGSGKSMMAKCLPGILPPLSAEESLETTKIHSVAGKLGRHTSLIRQRPFRAPHHTISGVALVGGGSFPQPGEISLAHNGVLFLDELPEFQRNVLEVLRQPLEEQKIHIARVRSSLEYPAGFMLVASMNPCPCGYYNHPTKPCVCRPGQVHKYLNKVSGPLMDRIDIQVEIVPVPFEKISSPTPSESSAEIRQRVVAARKRQADRFCGVKGVHCNAHMGSKLLARHATPDALGLKLLKQAMERLNLSARAYDRILKVARTIADLDGAEQINHTHIAEAVSYRALDREDWAAGV